jgi:hypothetical protein
MILYKSEQAAQENPFNYRIGTSWDYIGPIFDQMPHFAKALTLANFLHVGGQGVVRFRETGDRNYSYPLFVEYFKSTERTHKEAIADHLISFDWRRERENARELATMQAYLKALYTVDEVMQIMTAVIRAQSFSTRHVTGLDERCALTISEDLETVAPQTNGEWEVICTDRMSNEVIHRFISEREAHAIVRYYNGLREAKIGPRDYLTPIASARKVQQIALHQGHVPCVFINRTVGKFNLTMEFESEFAENYSLTEISLNEAQQIVWETFKFSKEAGFAFTYNIS